MGKAIRIERQNVSSDKKRRAESRQAKLEISDEVEEYYKQRDYTTKYAMISNRGVI